MFKYIALCRRMESYRYLGVFGVSEGTEGSFIMNYTRQEVLCSRHHTTCPITIELVTWIFALGRFGVIGVSIGWLCLMKQFLFCPVCTRFHFCVLGMPNICLRAKYVFTDSLSVHYDKNETIHAIVTAFAVHI